MRRSRRQLWFITTMGLLIGSCTSLRLQPFDPESAGAVPFALSDYLQVLQTVEASVGGKTLPFLFDTAGGATLLTPTVAESIGCQPFGRLTGFRHDGSRLDLPRCGRIDLLMGGLSLSAEAGVFDVMALLPKGAPELGGIVSLHTLGERAWTLDMYDRTLILETPASLAQNTIGMREIRVRTASQGGGAGLDLFLRVDTPHGDLWLEIDSGNSAGLILSPHALSQLRIDLPQDAHATVPVDLQISGFGRYSASAIIKDTIYDGLLDAGFLKGHRLTFDPVTGRAWLQAKAVP